MKTLTLLAALAALVAAALSVAAPARAGDVAMRVVDVPLGPSAGAKAAGARSLAAAARGHGTGARFNMLAAHWVGSGSVSYRVRSLDGAWSGWSVFDADVSPDVAERVRRRQAWHKGNLYWTGAANGVQYRTRGTVTRLRAYELWSRVRASVPRGLSNAGTPAIVSRAAWHANEEIVRARPLVAPVLKLAIVHHTAGSNSYTPAQSAAIVRGIELYHVQGNGWNDIGYNFLVDRFGTVYEGRGGGITKNVIGAHAEGFNAGTTGIALIGNYSTATPPKAQRDALVALLAWRLDVAHIDPLSTVLYTSGGNYTFRAGRHVTLRAISGHRDTGPSECPGNGAFALLPGIAARVSVTGLPKLYSPSVLGSLGGPVRFQARLSSALPWTVSVVDRAGKVVGQGAGTGRLVDWTLPPPAAGAGRLTGPLTWTIDAPGIRVATGTLGGGTIGTPPSPPPPAVLSLRGLTATPGVVAPAADGTGGEATVAFQLGAAAAVTATILDANGVTVAALPGEQRQAGANALVWSAAALPDGRYTFAVTATARGKAITKAIPLVVDRTVVGLTPSAAAFSPNGDGIDDTVQFSYTLTQNVTLRVDLTQNGAVVATPYQGQPGVGPHTLDWDGTSNGAVLPDGNYVAVFTVTDALGNVQFARPLAIDTVPPVLTLVDPATLEFSLSEAATVTVLVNQRTRLVQSAGAGTFSFGYAGPVAQFSAQAQDTAGNLSPLLTG